MISDFQFPSGAEGKEPTLIETQRSAQSFRSVTPVPSTGTTGELFPDLGPVSLTRVDTVQTVVAPADRCVRLVSDCQNSGAPGVESARAKLSIIDFARKQVAKEIITLMGDDIPCAPRFKKYLEKQSLADLVARRKQLQDENQRELNLEDGR